MMPQIHAVESLNKTTLTHSDYLFANSSATDKKFRTFILVFISFSLFFIVEK